MTQAELIEAIADATQLTKSDVKRVFDAYKDLGYQHFKKNKLNSDYVLPGFGKFKVSERLARVGINPQTGEKVKIPKKKVPVFRAGTELKSHIHPKKK